MSDKRHLVTVGLEDYYHVSAFNGVIERGQWSRFERRLEVGTDHTLNLLDEYGVRATFFVLGWVADAVPELVRRVAERGHEVASRGYYHRSLRDMPREEFRHDLAKASEALERASGQRVLGYRIAQRGIGPSDLWALDELAAAGYAYDSSLRPLLRRFSREPWRRVAHLHRSDGHSIWEFPLSALRILGFELPIAGGNYFRQLPHSLVSRAVAKWDRDETAPFVMYFHTWEMDPDQPRISAAPYYQQVRQYRNLDKMQAILRDYFTRYRFHGIADHLGLDHRVAAGPVRSSLPRPAAAQTPRSRPEAPAVRREQPQVAVSVVIPCYNEAAILPYLSNTLGQMIRELSAYRFHFIFVDDGSADGTAAALDATFGGRPDCTVIHQPSNQGVSAAILSGIRRAETEIVCSIDCDCTYDPLQLGQMIPLIAQGADLVTASPYHADGEVRNVPAWRLTLSKSASWLYRLVLRQKLATYTSCFRAYRRSAILDLTLDQPGFLGIVEMVGRLDLAGGRVAEFPTMLEARMLGHSKMKVVRNVIGHLGLLAQFTFLRLRGADSPGRRPLPSPHP